jgi:L-fuculokinase
MPSDLAVVLDCGATNARAVAIDETGQVVAEASRPNAPRPQPGGEPGWLIWDLDEVWGKLADASREACAGLSAGRIRAVTVTTFGADGAPLTRDGTLTYPIISWQCNRTEPTMQRLAQEMDPWDIYAETGYLLIPFNTLLRLLWLRQHAPQALDGADVWLMTPGLLSHRLSGEFSIDPTIAGTMMCMDMGKRTWSAEMLSLADLDASFFPRWVEPGEVIGQLTTAAAEATGLPAGIPVVAAGHDTQFAAVGSGTWEILMLRAGRYGPTRFAFEEGALIECDAEPGLWNPQLLMMASGVLEWIRDHFYRDIADRSNAYQQMIADARDLPPGATGVTVLPSFVAETGPTKKHNTHGTILGLTITTRREQVYRAALEGLACQLRHALGILREAFPFEPKGIRVVGGGARNDLWNQIRADVTGLPVTTISQLEATVLGAAMFALVGAGRFSSVHEAQAAMASGETTTEPSAARSAYDELYARYRLAPPALEGFYKA